MDNQTATTLKQFAERFVGALERIATALEQPPSALPQAGTLKAPGDALPIIPASAETVAAAPIAVREYAFSEVKAAVMAYQDKAGWASAQTLLKEFGATFIKDLNAKDYAALMAKLA